MHRFTPQMPAVSRVGPGLSQEAGTQFRSPHMVKGLLLLKLLPATSQDMHQQKAGVGSRARPQTKAMLWDLGIPAVPELLCQARALLCGRVPWHVQRPLGIPCAQLIQTAKSFSHKTVRQQNHQKSPRSTQALGGNGGEGEGGVWEQRERQRLAG